MVDALRTHHRAFAKHAVVGTPPFKVYVGCRCSIAIIYDGKESEK